MVLGARTQMAAVNSSSSEKTAKAPAVMKFPEEENQQQTQIHTHSLRW